MNFIVKDKIALKRLQCDKTLKREIRSIKIELETSSKDVKSYERKINRYYFACGCTIGQIAVFCTLVVFGVIWLINRDSALLTWWKVLACVFASALAGKTIGLFISHYLLKNTYSELGKLFA